MSPMSYTFQLLLLPGSKEQYRRLLKSVMAQKYRCRLCRWC